MVLWDGPDFKAKASRPAEDVLPVMLRRAWHDLRGAARRARKDGTEANLHTLRIRMKDLRYGCETVALIGDGPAHKTARAAERLQIKLGDLHDAIFSIAWFEDLADERPDLAEPLARWSAWSATRPPPPARGGSASSKRSSADGGAGEGRSVATDRRVIPAAESPRRLATRYRISRVDPYVIGGPQLHAAEDAGRVVDDRHVVVQVLPVDTARVAPADVEVVEEARPGGW